MPEAPLLEARELTRRFGGLVAVRGVSFQVTRGEILGIIGPNGAGKTTLFSMLAGALAPTAGDVFLVGKRITGLPPHLVVRRGMCRTHQIVRPFRDLTVLENVTVGATFGRRGRSIAEARGRGREVLEFTGLAGRAGVRAGALPIGELKRLEIARALATEPEVLLLDEVMGGLNPAEIDRTVELIRQIRSRGITILMIEHHIRAVVAVSDRILVLNYGRPIAEGRPEDVVRSPEVIAAYLGRPYSAQREVAAH